MKYRRFDNTLVRTVRVVTGVLLMTMFAAIMTEVVFRYLLSSPPVWTQEFARYVMLYMVLIGAVAGIRQEQHPALGFVVQKFPKGFRKWWRLFIDVLVLVVLLVVFQQGLVMAVEERIAKTAVLRISFFWVYLALPVGALLMMVQIVARHIKVFDEAAEKVSSSGEE